MQDRRRLFRVRLLRFAKSPGINLLPICFFLAAAFSGCNRPPVPAPQPVSAIPTSPQPSDFVICIDNSHSILPPEQVLVRESTMLLGDLVEANDQISVVTFGEGARIVASKLIQNDQHREAFRNQVRQGVNFQENLSDIRAGINLVANESGSLFRPSGSSRTVILLSDGRLEPADGDPPAAQEELNRTLAREPLSKLDLYAVALGRDRSPIPGLAIDGITLMEASIARSADHFFHAQSIDNVLESVVTILNKAKGSGSLEEPGTAEFRIDNTVESLTLVVRKRSTDGTELCRSGSIQLVAPDGRTAQRVNYQAVLGGSLYWNSAYEYFDLLRVTRPHEGNWKVALAGGGTPRVLSRINTPVELRFELKASSKSRVFVNEAAALTAWLFNQRDRTVSKEAYEIQAHATANGDLPNSRIHIPLLKAETESGQYWLEVPAGLTQAFSLNGRLGRIVFELVAHKLKDPAERSMDPYFVRRSPPLTLEIVEPFAEWTTHPDRATLIPLFKLIKPFGGTVNPEQKYYPAFDTPPRIMVSLERLDEKNKAYKPFQSPTIEAATSGSRFVYSHDTIFPDAGTYRYRYQLEGVTPQGAYIVRSPYYVLLVCYGWECWILAILLLHIALCVISCLTAKLSGLVILEEPEANYTADTLSPPMRLYDSDRLNGLSGGALGTDQRFTLKPRRFCYIRKRILLAVTRGKALLDGRPLATVQRLSLSPGSNQLLTFVNEDGTPMAVIRIQVTVV